MDRFFNSQILNEEITRKQFLRYALGLIIAIVGINNLIMNVQKWKPSPGAVTPKQPSKPSGFGSSKFGV